MIVSIADHWRYRLAQPSESTMCAADEPINKFLPLQMTPVCMATGTHEENERRACVGRRLNYRQSGHISSSSASLEVQWSFLLWRNIYDDVLPVLQQRIRKSTPVRQFPPVQRRNNVATIVNAVARQQTTHTSVRLFSVRVLTICDNPVQYNDIIVVHSQFTTV